MHCKKQFIGKSGSSLISRLSVVSFSPKIEQLNNQLTVIQAELGTICRNPDFRSAALDHGASAVWPEHTSYLEVSTGTPASLAAAQELGLETPANTLDLESRAKGAFLQMLEQGIFAIKYSDQEQEEILAHISLVYRGVPSQGQMGLGAACGCPGLGLPLSQPWPQAG